MSYIMIIGGGICLLVLGFILGNLNYQHRIAKWKIVELIWYILNRVDDHSQNQILTVIRRYRGYKKSKLKLEESESLT